MWWLAEFIHKKRSLVSPELLAIILVDALESLEEHHRRGEIHGRLSLEFIQISERGKVVIGGWGSDTRASTNGDIASLSEMFRNLIGDSARTHPSLKKILALGCTEMFKGAWELRAEVLNYLSDMGIEGEYFFVSNFIADPESYNRALIITLSEHEYVRIRELNRSGRRRMAALELNFLFEIAPINRQVLLLWRSVKRGRRDAILRLCTIVVIVFIVGSSGPIIASKLNLTWPKSNKLIVEPVAQNPELHEAARIERRPAGVETIMVLGQTINSVPAHLHPSPGMGGVQLELPADATAYFDGKVGVVKSYGNQELAWLSIGQHTITVTMPGVPPAMALLQLKSDRIINLTAQIVGH